MSDQIYEISFSRLENGVPDPHTSKIISPTASKKLALRADKKVGEKKGRANCAVVWREGGMATHNRKKKQREIQLELVQTMKKYCENQYGCRREIILSYFGEPFPKTKCAGTCDNCKASASGQKRPRLL